MIIKLKRGDAIGFLNKEILYVDVKMVKLDRVLTNLFIKIYADGRPVTSRMRAEFKIDTIKDNLCTLQDSEGCVVGAREYPEGVEDWLRSSLLELVFPGNVAKEHIATLKPLHLVSFKVRNTKYCRDYRASDQLYLMLKSNPEVMNGLVEYLSKGWDKSTNEMVMRSDIDVDTAGILYITKPLKLKNSTNTEALDIPKPFLRKQTELFNDDIRRLLMYKDKMPRAVFIDYLRILCGFHLALYTLKTVYLLPKMVEAGTRDIEDDWQMVVDLTDNLDSPVAPYACKDFEKIENGIGKYVRSTYMVDIVQARRPCNIDVALDNLKNSDVTKDSYYEILVQNIKKNLPEDDDKEFDRMDFAEMLELFPENDYFDMYVHIMEKSNLGGYQQRYLKEFIDSVSMKNQSSMLLADSRSRRHPRRGALGAKLLETMVQLLVLREKEGGKYETRSLSIDELANEIRNRYGLVINGTNEKRFEDADVEMNKAFRINMEAFKNKLRQIGFYTDMSDACILQKIRPRYKLED